VEQADVSEWTAINRVLCRINESKFPLAGVIHSAGMLSDGVLQNQSWSSFEKVMAPKVQGAWYLHELTKDQELDFFVMFSSVASLLGSPGQGNYCAANAFLDTLAHYRRGMGLTGLSIHWGAVSQVGVAATRGVDVRAQEKGMGVLAPAQLLESLELLMSGSGVEVGVVPIDWSMWQKQAEKSLFLAECVNKASDSSLSQPEFLQQLEAAVPSERQELLVAYVRLLVAKVLGISDSHSIGLEQGFFDLGMDSLASLELRNSLQTEIGVNIPIQEWTEELTINTLSAKVARQLIKPSKLLWENIELSNLVPIQPNGSKIPFFCVCGGIGIASYLSFLGQYLDPNQPFYALQSPDLDGKSRPMNQVQEMASKHIQAIQTIQPQGPYLIGGNSFGAIVAFEIAQQLIHQEHQVNLLAILDMRAPSNTRSQQISPPTTEDIIRMFIPVAKVFGRSRKNVQLLSFEDLASVSYDEQLQYYKEKLVEFGAISSTIDINRLKAIIEVGKANGEAYQNYLLPKILFPVPIVLFRAEEQWDASSERFKEEFYKNFEDPTWGWNKLSSQTVEVHMIPGDHLTMMVPPNVQLLAQQLQKLLYGGNLTG
ncbi:KR domain-containing protein, partial [Moorena sp. SIO3H5]|uniref:KR domain-containing protein n=1 Tax=Moorena sp. SIO3H5 TaxID=2607834 RepID=UPI0013B9A982